MLPASTRSTDESSPRRLRVLTVGDGDLSLSLSLARCFGPYLDLTATTLVESSEALCATYPATAESHLRELQQVHSVNVLFGVNACLLHVNPTLVEQQQQQQQHWDVISFHHPHLGCDSHSHKDHPTTDRELDLLQRHTSLLAHYLHSAAQLLTTTVASSHSNSIIHVALCANQAESWQLHPAVERLGLELVFQQGLPIQRPFYQIFPKLSTGDVFPWDLDPHWQPQLQQPSTETTTTTTTRQRRTISKRYGGSRHWLGQFGYRHVRTVPSTVSSGTNAPNLTASRHYAIRPVVGGNPPHAVSTAPHATLIPTPTTTSPAAPAKVLGTSGQDEDSSLGSNLLLEFCCPICSIPFGSRSELEAHWNDPASPKQHRVEALATAATTTVAAPLNRNDQPSVGPPGNASTFDHPTKTSSTSSIIQGFMLVEILESNPEGHDNNNTRDKNTVTVVLQVTKAVAGKRLRWCLQHLLLNHCCGSADKAKQLPRGLQSFSNSDWNRFIKQGGVSVNGALALDTGRILQEGWTIELKLHLDSKLGANVDATLFAEHDDCSPELQVVGKWNPSNAEENTVFFVVWKPVGMRAIGSFETGTLEETFSRQQQKFRKHGQHPPVTTKYTSFSRLDTGCSGLCVLAPSGVWQENDVEIVHTFTALVHGQVPDEWTTGVSVPLAVDSVRRWKKKQAKTSQPKNSCIALFLCTERTTTTSPTNDASPVVPALSTIAISINSRSSRLASIIALYLRTVARHPVVGDRVAVTEYLALPRSMRNRIKQRFCLGCTRIELDVVRSSEQQQQQQQEQQQQEQHVTEHQIPERWSARYWQKFCTSSTASKGKTA